MKYKSNKKTLSQAKQQKIKKLKVPTLKSKVISTKLKKFKPNS